MTKNVSKGCDDELGSRRTIQDEFPGLLWSCD